MTAWESMKVNQAGFIKLNKIIIVVHISRNKARFCLGVCYAIACVILLLWRLSSASRVLYAQTAVINTILLDNVLPPALCKLCLCTVSLSTLSDIVFDAIWFS